MSIDTHLHTRRAQPEDVEHIARLLAGTSSDSYYLRYFQPLPSAPDPFWREAERLVHQHAGYGITLVAMLQPTTHEIIAVAELARNAAAAHHGEVAILVRDAYQNQGVGGVLARQIVQLAQAYGLTQLHADILPKNRASLRLLPHFGVPYVTSIDSGLRHIVLQL